MACLSWTSTVTSHLDIATQVLLVRVGLQVIDVAYGLTHLARRDDLWMLHACAEACSSSSPRARCLLASGISMSERCCICTDWCSVLGTKRLPRVKFLRKCLVLLYRGRRDTRLIHFTAIAASRNVHRMIGR